MDPVIRKAKNHHNATGKSLFREWITRKIDGEIRSRINSRIRRIEEFGNYGDCEPVGGSVYELKLDIGPGYGIYFGIDEGDLILLNGGDKSTQESDIQKARECWEDYNS